MQDVRVMVVDNHEVVRCGLKSVLKRFGHLRIVAEAESVATALAEAARATPDVIVMDVRLPDGSGIDACRAVRARHPGVRVLMLTGYDDEEALHAATLAGAAGFVLKDARAAELVQAIEAVARGQSLLPSAVPATKHGAARRPLGRLSAGALASLTAKQRRILDLVAAGKTNHEIALEVALSEKTVKNAVSVLLHKLGMAHRSQVAAFMARQRAWHDGEPRA
jgi:DNA-binding NarL/FixJ family response regulator